MPLSAQEQYLLELINRARLNPVAEANRYGIDLNANLAAGTLNGTSKQVLAPNALLEAAATKHSQWMLATDIFSHTGANGSTLATRVNAEGYKWSTLGENIAVWGGSGTVNLTTAIEQHHKGLFLSAGHRTNLLHGGFSEVGLAQEVGKYRFNPTSAESNVSMLTEVFGAQPGGKFLTGVVYNDNDLNTFYSIGEGQANVSFAMAGGVALSEAAGGYAVKTTATGFADVAGYVGGVYFTAAIDFSGGNVKLDIVNGDTVFVSSNISMGSAFIKVSQLGVASLSVNGNGLDNTINGNGGANFLVGNGGNDLIFGNHANDILHGGQGNDTLNGGWGHDRLEGHDGVDILIGDLNNDELSGGLGADQFMFSNTHGADVIEDFSLAQQDRLMIDNDLWTGTLTTQQVVNQFATVSGNHVVFNFGDGDSLTLLNVNSLTGLAAAITII
jgi:serralysin